MYQLMHVSLIGSLILAFFLGSASAANASSGASSKLLQQSTGTIVIVKDTVPDDPQDFAFQLTPAGGGQVLDDDPSNGSASRQFSRTVEAGIYTATEAAVTGWNVTAVTCDDPDSGSSGNPANRSATIDLDTGEAVTCTFRNEPDLSVPRGTLVIVKDTVPNDPQDFRFTIPGIHIALLDDDSGSTTPNQYSAVVVAKTYTATEEDVTGWNLTALTCTDPDNGSSTDLAARRATIDVDAGETVTCTFRNEAAPSGIIRVIKNAIPDDPQDFLVQLRDASGVATGGSLLDDDPGSALPNEFSLIREAGIYTAVEDAVSGWTLTGLTCDDPDNQSSGDTLTRTATIDLDANETVTCTFTNTKDDQPPATATPTNTPTATATPTPTNTATPTNIPTSTGTGTVIIVKDAQPNDPQDFKFFGGDLQVAPFFLDDDSDPTLPNQIMFTNVTSGIHFVQEDQDPIGWDLTNITCDDPSNDSFTNLANREVAIVLHAGETVTCTFTNTNVGGTVVIIKDAVPNDPQDFKFFGGDLQVAPFFLDDDSDPTLSNQITFTNVNPGIHFVQEDQDPPDWSLTGITCVDPDNGSSAHLTSREARIEVDANETVTCTFTNTKDGQPTTGAPTNTLTATATFIPPTGTATPTITATPSQTPTPTKTGTPTKTPTKTATPTKTRTPSQIPTSPPSGPTCEGFAATIYVNSQGRIVGGPNNGQTYQGSLIGTNGVDIIVGTTGGDNIDGNGGNDRICSGGGSDDVEGGEGDDRIFGGNGNDELEGDAGNDRISGQDGSDKMYGEDGSDLLTGGPSADVFNGGTGTDTATDFSSSQGDTKTSVENT